jgi:GDPmannose 4,6-dehydratase
MRGKKFVTRKVTRYVAALKDFYDRSPEEVGDTPPTLKLGNLEACRDWGFAGDYVEAMWMMLQAEEPDDYVVATGKTYSIKDLCREAFDVIGICDWDVYVETDPEFVRPLDVEYLLGNASKIRVGTQDIIPRTSSHDGPG